MEAFYRDCLRFGCLANFKHFSLYLRGREELLVTIRHPPEAEGASHAASVDQKEKNKQATFGVTSQQLPPASPATRESSSDNPTETVFLIGAYARYNWPYVWLRSNLGKFGGNSADKDLPLDLNTTQRWKEEGFRVWDIVEELVQMNVVPAPMDPFEVDFTAFDIMPDLERSLLAGALAFFLRDLLLRDIPYAEIVQRDLLRVLEVHFRGGGVPIESEEKEM